MSSSNHWFLEIVWVLSTWIGCLAHDYCNKTRKVHSKTTWAGPGAQEKRSINSQGCPVPWVLISLWDCGHKQILQNLQEPTPPKFKSLTPHNGWFGQKFPSPKRAYIYLMHKIRTSSYGSHLIPLSFHPEWKMGESKTNLHSFRMDIK